LWLYHDMSVIGADGGEFTSAQGGHGKPTGTQDQPDGSNDT